MKDFTPFKSGIEILKQVLLTKDFKIKEISRLKNWKYRKIPAQFEQDPKPVRLSSKEFKKLLENCDKLIGSSLIVGFSSSIGEQAGVGLTTLTKALIDKGFNGLIEDAYSFNRQVVDFDTGVDYIAEIKKADFVSFYFINGIESTEFKTKRWNEVVDVCRLFKKPLLVSFNAGFQHKLTLMEIKMQDKVANPTELFNSLVDV